MNVIEKILFKLSQTPRLPLSPLEIFVLEQVFPETYKEYLNNLN